MSFKGISCWSCFHLHEIFLFNFYQQLFNILQKVFGLKYLKSEVQLIFKLISLKTQIPYLFLNNTVNAKLYLCIPYWNIIVVYFNKK